LTYDRNAYRNYLKSKPFHGVKDADSASTSSSTPKNKNKFTPSAIPTYEELRIPKLGSTEGGDEDTKGDDHQTPTKAGKGKGKEVTMDEDKQAWLDRA
jgi:hypothetical protein